MRYASTAHEISRAHFDCDRLVRLVLVVIELMMITVKGGESVACGNF